MFLSNEILKKYNACELGLKWFDRHYPDGVELMDFLDNARVFVGPDSKILELLYWGYRILPYDEREKEKYREILDIDTSEQVFESFNVINSEKVIRSHDIYNSKHIEDSTRITKSFGVHRSHDIQDSMGILNSYSIWNSNWVSMSSNVKNSYDIQACSNIVLSGNSAWSDNITRCRGLFYSNDCQEVYYSQNMNNCHHCLFCKDLENASFMIFNNPVTEKDFFVIFELVQKPFIIHTIPIANWHKKEDTYFGYTWKGLVSPSKIYSEVPQSGFDFLSTLPNYNSWMMYQLTLNSKSFQDLKNS